MDDKKKCFEKLLVDLWWTMPLVIIALALLITSFDPVGNLLVPQAKRIIVAIAILDGVVLYAIYVGARGK